jgi:hypothetical protein
MMMTEEELREEFRNVKDELNRLAQSEKPLTKEEKRLKFALEQSKDVLRRIKETKDKEDKMQEVRHTADYNLLKSYGKRHPLLLHILRIKLRGNIL